MQDAPSLPVSSPTRIRRRDLLGAGALGAAGLLAPAAARADGDAPRVQRYVPLGSTGLEISDISFGSSRMRDPKAVRHAYERGVNYFDSAEGYKGGGSDRRVHVLRECRARSIEAVSFGVVLDGRDPARPIGHQRGNLYHESARPTAAADSHMRDTRWIIQKAPRPPTT